MKTEQEQTKQMLKTLCDKFQCSAIDRSYMAKSCRQCEDIIEALHEAGYGDVSEYKAEIERLKAENKSRERENGFLKFCQCLTHGVDGSNHIKQAQIDVLNKAKERIKTAIDTYFNLDGGGYYLAEGAIDDIDGLIEEVENEN